MRTNRLVLGAVSAVAAVALTLSGCSKKTTSSVASSAAPIATSSQVQALETSKASAETVAAIQACETSTGLPRSGWFKAFGACVQQKLQVDPTTFENCALNTAINPPPAVTAKATTTASATASPAASTTVSATN